MELIAEPDVFLLEVWKQGIEIAKHGRPHPAGDRRGAFRRFGRVGTGVVDEPVRVRRHIDVARGQGASERIGRLIAQGDRAVQRDPAEKAGVLQLVGGRMGAVALEIAVPERQPAGQRLQVDPAPAAGADVDD